MAAFMPSLPVREYEFPIQNKRNQWIESNFNTFKTNGLPIDIIKEIESLPPISASEVGLHPDQAEVVKQEDDPDKYSLICKCIKELMHNKSKTGWCEQTPKKRVSKSHSYNDNPIGVNTDNDVKRMIFLAYTNTNNEISEEERYTNTNDEEAYMMKTLATTCIGVAICSVNEANRSMDIKAVCTNPFVIYSKISAITVEDYHVKKGSFILFDMIKEYCVSHGIITNTVDAMNERESKLYKETGSFKKSSPYIKMDRKTEYYFGVQRLYPN